MKGMKILVFVMLLTTGVALLWDKLPAVKKIVHAILDPTAGVLLNWHITWGFIFITAIITLVTTLIQKYTTDQAALKSLKDEQKKLQEEMKQHRDKPEKMMEIQKKQFELISQTMPLTMRPLLYTAIPFVLFLRWFGDYFLLHTSVKIIGLSWFWAYLILSIILSTIFRKMFKVQ